MIKIIGIDPGLSATGIGIVQGNGSRIDGYFFDSIHTTPKSSLPNRLDQIFLKLLCLLKQENPDLMVVEDVFSLSKYPKSAITLGQVTGVVLLAGAQAGVASMEIPVREAKQVLTGNGNASKMQLEAAVRRRLNHAAPIRPNHASDAVGLALIGFYRYRDRPAAKKNGTARPPWHEGLKTK
jgi:crossover junction endodeoxyribonuclease RuvC